MTKVITSDWSRSPQPDRFSNSSSETKANTLSSASAEDDLDGSDSLAEYHANYIQSAGSSAAPPRPAHTRPQPDLLSTGPALAPKPKLSSYTNASYQHSERYIHDIYQAASLLLLIFFFFSRRSYGNYAEQSSLYYSHYPNSPPPPHPDYANPYPPLPGPGYPPLPSHAPAPAPSYTAGTSADTALYSSGRFNAVAHKLSVIGGLAGEDLNESSIGTHV